MSRVSKQNVMLFNGAAAVLIVGSFVYAVTTAVTPASIPPCSSAERVAGERYPRGMQMGLETSGRMMSAADLQARAGGTDWGLLERVKVTKVSDGPAKAALEYTVTHQKAGDREGAGGQEGAGFIWAPRALQAAKSACLAYALFVPDGFDFGAGGRLPGFMGASKPQEAATAGDAKPRDAEEQGQPFLAMPNWDNLGTVGPALLIGKADGSNGWSRFGAFEMARGRWIAIEQEVIMNTPGESDGIVRTWVNGSLAVDARTAFNAKAPVNLTGVLAEVAALGAPVDPKAKNQRVSITPFIVYLK